MTPTRNTGRYCPPGFSYAELQLMEKKHKEITAIAKKHFLTQDEFDKEVKQTLSELLNPEYKFLRESLISSTLKK